MDCDIHAIVELDRINMAPVIERAGGKFDPVFRRARVQRELERGAEFVCCIRNGVLLAYLELMSESPGAWNVLSIQIHPDYQRGWIMLPLLKVTYLRLKDMNITSVCSSVHETNRASLRLHQKLGFQEEKRAADRILFRISGDLLFSRLSRIFSKKWPNKSLEPTPTAVTSRAT